MKAEGELGRRELALEQYAYGVGGERASVEIPPVDPAEDDGRTGKRDAPLSKKNVARRPITAKEGLAAREARSTCASDPPKNEKARKPSGSHA